MFHAPETVTLADGRKVDARTGDVRIARGTLTLDVLAPERYLSEYEPVIEGGLQLTPQECDRLCELLGLAATATGSSLLAAVTRLGAIGIGDIRIPFTPGQLSELQHRARKRGRTVEAEMKAVVARIEEELFYKGG